MAGNLEEATANPGESRKMAKPKGDPAFVRNDATPDGALECTVCGALVGDVELHRQSHQ